MSHTQEVIDKFYSDLSAIVTKIPANDKIIILGDFNARTGSDNLTWPVLGPHGVGNCNTNGLQLLTFCTQYNLAVSSTFFQQKDKYKCTWMHPRSKHWHLIDYVLVRKKDIQDVLTVRALRGAECWTDHRLVRAKLNLVVRPKIRKVCSIIPLNVSKLKSDEVKKEFEEAINNLPELDSENLWSEFREKVFQSASDCLGFKKRSSRDWFNESDDEISKLLKDKQDIHRKLLSLGVDHSDYQRVLSEFKEVKALAQRKIRQMKDAWWERVASDAQQAFDRNDTKSFYLYVREVFGPSKAAIAPLKSKDGKELHKDSNSIQKRWVEHYSELLNRPSSVDMDTVNLVEQLPIVQELEDMPTLSEVSDAIKKLNSGKSPGLDGIPAEILKACGNRMAELVHDLIQRCWRTESVPKEWIDATLVSLFKSGQRDDCGNFRGISLLSVVGKVLARVILDRLIKHIAPHAISESQCGFR